MQLKALHRWQWRRSPRPVALGVVGNSLWWRHVGKLLCPAVVCPVWSLRIHQTSDRINQPKQSHQKGKRGSDETDLQKAEFRHVSLRISRTDLYKEQKHTRATLPSIPEVTNTYWLKNTILYFYFSWKLAFYQFRRETAFAEYGKLILPWCCFEKLDKMPQIRPKITDKTPKTKVKILVFLTRIDDGIVCVEMLQLCQTRCRFAFSCHDISLNLFVKWEFPT